MPKTKNDKKKRNYVLLNAFKSRFLAVANLYMIYDNVNVYSTYYANFYRYCFTSCDIERDMFGKEIHSHSSPDVNTM